MTRLQQFQNTLDSLFINIPQIWEPYQQLPKAGKLLLMTKAIDITSVRDTLKILAANDLGAIENLFVYHAKREGLEEKKIEEVKTKLNGMPPEERDKLRKIAIRLCIIAQKA
jgi:pyruvate dehydrogenase complex dehydrogenase (E1) component